MDDYIKRDQLLKSKQWLALSAHDIATAKSIILGQPASDVVAVVRCKDCACSAYPETKIVWCKRHNKYMPLNGFCNYGDRKDSDCNG